MGFAILLQGLQIAKQAINISSRPKGVNRQCVLTVRLLTMKAADIGWLRKAGGGAWGLCRCSKRLT
jgi:hypothetical protein